MKQQSIENSAFLFSLAIISLLFLTMLQPFFGAVLWACVLALLFYPLQKRLLSRWQKPNTVALITLLICTLVGIVPAIFLLLSFFHEGAQLYQKLQSGELDPAAWLLQINQAFPFVQDALHKFNIDLSKINQELTEKAFSTSQVLAHYAMNLGQKALQFIMSLGLMLYLLFFMLRDGPALLAILVRALPLGDEREHLIFTKFSEVTRATIKGNLVVAIIQGGLGGFIFWALDVPAPILWGVVMVVLSLIPVVGAGLIWGPVALYLFAIGDYTEATILTAFGFGVIGLVDNVLRPILVSRDTKMPDYLVLLSTLGGISLFGLNGFLLGPLVAALFMAFWDIFAKDFNS